MWEILDEARSLATAAGEIQRIGPVAVARAEAAWLHGKLGDQAQEIEEALSLVRQTGSWEFGGAIAFWRWRTAAKEATRRKERATAREKFPAPVRAPRGSPGNANGSLHESKEGSFPSSNPYVMRMTGRWREAAKERNRLGWPYHRAMALADGDEAAQCETLNILHGLGARPAAQRVRVTLQKRGIRGLPRGPRASTRANPRSLTPRQTEILERMAEGRTNVQIAERLFIAPKTVEHHVSAILAKLGATSRAAAVQQARELGFELGETPHRGGAMPK